ncbi:hypothetical protein B0H16DRAFT_1480197 [Mycena metata]|uniref:Uncharacterized protein n=1 Tax=Mycena metata TaxID=1033252 RepID=A0AAD7H4A5_9AGAR|nr:hypothetical protein B0H16DRAFT_1480197 [Mycena metata]
MAFRRRSDFTLTCLSLCFHFSDIGGDIVEILDTFQKVKEHTALDRPLTIPETSRLLEKLGVGSYDSLCFPKLHFLDIDTTRENLQMLTSNAGTYPGRWRGCRFDMKRMPLFGGGYYAISSEEKEDKDEEGEGEEEELEEEGEGRRMRKERKILIMVLAFSTPLNIS